MDFSKTKQCILFLDRNRFDYFDGTTGQIITMPFPETIISSLDVLSVEGFEQQIKLFIEQNKLLPTNIVVILSSNVLFEKDIVDVPVDQQTAEVEKFLDIVPFDNLATKLIPLQKGVRISAVNKDLCDSLATGFEKCGFKIESIIPYEELQPEIMQFTALDGPTLTVIMKKIDSIKNFSFVFDMKIPAREKAKLQTSDKNSSQQKMAPDKKEAPNKIRIIALIIIFGILIAVLAFMLLRSS